LLSPTVSNFVSEGIDFGKQLKVPTVGRIIGRVRCSARSQPGIRAFVRQPRAFVEQP
jgi:hypothetical protein